MRYKTFVKALHWISLNVLLALATIAFLSAGKTIADVSSPLIPSNVHPFIPGFLMMAVNPVQIPFWAGWNTVLFENDIMQRRESHYNVFTLGASAGALGGSIVFIYAGQLFMASANAPQKTINIIIGSVFLVMAVLQGMRMIKSKR